MGRVRGKEQRGRANYDFFNFRIIQIVQIKRKFVFIQKPGNKTAKFKLVFCENKIPTCNFFI